MRLKSGVFFALANCLWVAPGLAQVSSVGGAPSVPAGAGPRIEFQVGPNGTLDISGAQSIDTNMVGENFRGNLGSSRSQTNLPGGSKLPSSSFPEQSVTIPFRTPNFGPNLTGSLPDAGSGLNRAKVDIGSYSNFILPRFRTGDDGQPAMPTRSRMNPSDSWRYRYFNNRWWYWKTDKTWSYWNGTSWLDHTSHS